MVLDSMYVVLEHTPIHLPIYRMYVVLEHTNAWRVGHAPTFTISRMSTVYFAAGVFQANTGA